MKNKKKFIIIGVIVAVLVVIAIVLYSMFGGKNRLTIIEKEWINDNRDSVINVAVLNDVNNFGLDGKGVYFEFLNDFAKEHGFTVNPVAFTYGADPEGLSLSLKHTPEKEDVVFYKDHYVLVNKEEKALTDMAELNGANLAALTGDIDYLTSYLPNVTFTPFDSRVSLMDAVSSNTEIAYAIVPLNMFINQILTSNYHIAYHLSDIPSYYTLSFIAKDTFTSIMTKFSNTWIDEKFNSSYNTHNLSTFINALGITTKDQDVLTSKVYYYGSVVNAPFEVASTNDFGGIVSEYLNKFSEFSNVEFKYVNYKKLDRLSKGIKNNEVDLYFNFNNLENEMQEVKTLINTDIVIIAPEKDYRSVNTLAGLKNDTIYVAENSNIDYYLKNFLYLKIKTYKTERELNNLRKKGEIIALEKLAFDYYVDHGFQKYSVRYEEKIGSPYTFKVNGDATFYKLFNEYVRSLDAKEMEYKGLGTYGVVKHKSSLLFKIATYALILISIGVIAVVLLIKNKKTIKLSNKISKEDRIRYIDMLTSLKNRNYLNENIDSWNKNTIYPQAAIIVDLNNVKYINDTFGTNEGDNQIKMAANILIKTQLDNTDIIRTDGNEFLIYMVGYEEKRIVSFIRKLYKEFATLPYEYGAAIGYSMREDDLKTIDDAINEATLDMRTKKESREKGV